MPPRKRIERKPRKVESLNPYEVAARIVRERSTSSRADLIHKIALELRRTMPESQYPQMNTRAVTAIANEVAEAVFPKSPKKKRGQ